MIQAIGPYEVVRELGRGGMGVVYEVRDPSLPDRRLALKLMRADMADEDSLRRFAREVELLARVRHKNVVSVHAISSGREGPFLLMDLVRGRPLRGADLVLAELPPIVERLRAASPPA